MPLDISRNPFMYNYLILFNNLSLNLCNLCNKGQTGLNLSNPIAKPINDSS